MRRSRRARQPPPDLTSLFDVLFIVIFAALIRAAAVQQAAAQPPAPPPKPQPQPMDPRSLQARALASIDKQLAARPAIVVRVSAAGTITALERDGQTIALDVPLLEHVADPDVAVAYLGDRSAELRACRVAALHANLPDLANYLVVIAPDRPLAELPHALHDGLHRDVDRCLSEQHGIAVIVTP
jgi:hypothetical protein